MNFENLQLYFDKHSQPQVKYLYSKQESPDNEGSVFQGC
jgi:hypothetical protein